MGESCYVGHKCRIEAWDSYLDDLFSPIINMGNNVKINSNCHIGAINMIEIGDDCLFGSNLMLIDHSHGETTFNNSKIHPCERKLYSKGKIIIEERCWLAENVVVLPGVTIGEGSIIGANAVVTKNIPKYSVAVGNPAKVVKTICDSDRDREE